MDFSITATTQQTTLVFAIVFLVVIGSMFIGVLKSRKVATK